MKCAKLFVNYRSQKGNVSTTHFVSKSKLNIYPASHFKFTSTPRMRIEEYKTCHNTIQVEQIKDWFDSGLEQILTIICSLSLLEFIPSSLFLAKVATRIFTRNLIGKRMTGVEAMEKNEKSVTDEEPKINYRGWKVMPFIIGKQKKPCTCIYII